MVLCLDITNSDVNRKFKQVLKDQEQNQYKTHFTRKYKKIAKDLQIDISDASFTSKLKWKKRKRKSNRKNKKR